MQTYLTSFTDQNLTQEIARLRLPYDKVVAGRYANHQIQQSIVHSHPYHEYIYMISGRASYHVNGSRYELHPGEFLLIPAETVHSGFYQNYTRLILQIDSTFWQETLALAGLVSDSYVPVRQLLIFQSSAASKWSIQNLIERAAVFSGIDDLTDKELLQRTLLTELSAVIHRMMVEHGLGKPSATSPLVASATAYIQEHFRDPDLTVRQLAQHAYVSREHLSRAFKEYTMQTVQEYITGLRMQSCRRDIAAGKHILNACLENGFSNYTSFLKSFRKRYGITPQEYRTQLRNALKSSFPEPPFHQTENQ